MTPPLTEDWFTAEQVDKLFSTPSNRNWQHEVDILLGTMEGKETMEKAKTADSDTEISDLKRKIQEQNLRIVKLETDVAYLDGKQLEREHTVPLWEYAKGIAGATAYGIWKYGPNIILIAALLFFMFQYFRHEGQKETNPPAPVIEITEPELGILKKATEQYIKDMRDMGKAEALEVFRLNTAAVREHYPNWKGVPE